MSKEINKTGTSRKLKPRETRPRTSDTMCLTSKVRPLTLSSFDNFYDSFY